MTDILRDIHRMPPVDTHFVAGRWHRDRMALAGHLAEARVALQSLSRPRSGPRVKFLIVARARSGTTLLRRLLNAQERLACTGEILARAMWAPATYLDRVARKSPHEVWGAKLLSYQMVQVQRIKEPAGFLRGLERRGFRFVHLVRRTLPQTLSLAVAQASSRYHSDRVTGKGPASLRLDPQDFLARIRWSDALLRYEERIFEEIPHRRLSYEADLLDPACQAETVAALCDWFGIPFTRAPATLEKLLPQAPADFVDNWDEVSDALCQSGFSHLL